MPYKAIEFSGIDQKKRSEIKAVEGLRMFQEKAEGQGHRRSSNVPEEDRRGSRL